VQIGWSCLGNQRKLETSAVAKTQEVGHPEDFPHRKNLPATFLPDLQPENPSFAEFADIISNNHYGSKSVTYRHTCEHSV